MKKLILFFPVFILCLSLNISAQAQTSIGSYTFTNLVGTYVPLAADSALTTGFSGSLYDDCMSPAVQIVFPFKFGNRTFTSFKLNSNGFITFNIASTTGFVSSALSSSETQLIAVFSRDLNGSVAAGSRFSIERDNSGGVGNRILKIQWKNLFSYNGVSQFVPEVFNAQIWLYEGTNVIEIKYGSCLPGARTVSSTVQVGLKSGSTAADSIRSLSGATWPGVAAGNSSASTVTISTAVLPDSNRVYKWTPQPVLANDVGISANVAPISPIYDNSPLVAPKATVKNYGSNNQTSPFVASFPVTYKISGPAAYSSTKNDTVSAFLSNNVTFDSTWLPNVPGTYNITIYTSLASDENRSNDTLKTTVTVSPSQLVNIVNVEPVDSVNNGYTYAPKATFTNNGNVALTSFNVNYQINGPTFGGVGYNSTKNIASLAIGASVTITFDSTFNPIDTGNYSINISSALGDAMPPLAASLKIISRNSGVRKSASCDYWWSNSQSLLAPPNRPTYSWKDPDNAPNKIVMINNGVNQLGSKNVSGLDDGYYLYGDTLAAIGKCIKVCGVDYNGFYPGTNGLIGLTNNNTVPANMTAFTVSTSTGPAADANHSILLPWYKDLNFTNATGQPPNRFSFYISKVNGVAKELVITWENVCIYQSPLVNTNYVSFQACIELVDCGSGQNSNIRYNYNFDKTGPGLKTLYGSGTPPTTLSITGLSNNGSNLVGIRTVGAGAMYYRKDSRPLIGGAQYEGPLFTTAGGAATGGLSVEFGELGKRLDKLNSRVVSVKVWIEGYRMSGTALLDTFKISIRNAISPYSIIETISARTLANGRVNVLSGYIYPGEQYYLMVNQRNTINTWTKVVTAATSLLASDTLSYDLTTAITQAFGDNEVVVSGAATMFSGDADKNGSVEAGDLAIVDNDAFNFVTGYKPSDVNGDNQTDSQDMSIVDNNAFNFVQEKKPIGAEPANIFMPKLVPDASETASENAYATEKLNSSKKIEKEDSVQQEKK